MLARRPCDPRAIDLLARLKSYPCADCGLRLPPAVMEFDHVALNKLDSVSHFAHAGADLAAVAREIAKCEVVCSVCHRLREQARHPANLGFQRRNWAVMRLKSRPCASCGDRFPPAAMDIDISRLPGRPSISALARRFSSHSLFKLLRPLPTLCANCHRLQAGTGSALLSS